MKIFKLIWTLLVFSMAGNCQESKIKNEKISVQFPSVSEPVQLVNNGKEHFYASYYGINSFSKNQKYALILETDIKYRLPTEQDTATLGIVNLDSHTFIPLTTTRAWNFQQGCMAHWLGTSPDSLIIFNDLREGKFVSIIMNVHTGKEIKRIPYPISAVSPNGKEAVSINFSRIRITRSDYGYGGEGQDAQPDVQFPDNDGIFLVNLESGSAELIVSIQDIREFVPEIDNIGIEYFNHTLFSREGSKIFWLARAVPRRNTTAFTVNTDGTNLQRCFPDGWGGSHFDWLDDNILMITGKYRAKQNSHILFTIGKTNYHRVGNGLLDFDGHGTFSPNKKWMVTDTYPSEGLNEQKIHLMEMKSQSAITIGKYYEPDEFTETGSFENRHGRFWRCDLHCRWSPNGDIIGFNSTHTGSRQAYIIKLNF